MFVGLASNTGGQALSSITPAHFKAGASGTYTDIVSSGTVSNAFSSLFVPGTFAARLATTYTTAATVYISAAPTAGTNVTLTNPYALYVAAGTSYFGGALTAASTVTMSPANNSVTISPTGTGTVTLSPATAGSLNNMIIGNSTAAAATVTALTATGAITLNTTTNNQSYTTTGAGTITFSSGTTGSINNMTIGGTTAAAGTFTAATSPTVSGGTTASSTLTLQSTSGSGTTDSIQFKIASQAEVARYDTSGAYFFKKVANAVNASATLTVAQLQGGIITSTTAAPVTMTMPTGTVLDTAGTGLAATSLATNETIQFTIKNTGAVNAIVVAVAAGVTNGGVAGDLTIAASGTATYLLTKTGSNTFVLYKQ